MWSQRAASAAGAMRWWMVRRAASGSGSAAPASETSATATSAAGGAPASMWDPKMVLGVGLFGSMVAGTFYLGTWQLMRYQWKVDLIEQRVAALAAPPLPLPRCEEHGGGGGDPRAPQRSLTRDALSEAAPGLLTAPCRLSLRGGFVVNDGGPAHHRLGHVVFRHT